jgi:hypothetical protein
MMQMLKIVFFRDPRKRHVLHIQRKGHEIVGGAICIEDTISQERMIRTVMTPDAVVMKPSKSLTRVFKSSTSLYGQILCVALAIEELGAKITSS